MTPTPGIDRPTTEPLAPLELSVHHLQLAIPAGAEDVCRAFWIGVLGMSEVPKPPALAERGGIWLRGGTLELHLGVDPDFRPQRKAHPGLRVPDVDEVARRLDAAGSPVRWDEAFAGMRRFHTDDPVGNRLEFLQPEDPAA